MSGGPPGSQAPNRRNQLIVLGVLAAVILIVAIVVSQSGPDDSDGGGEEVDTASVEKALAGIPQEGIFLGDREAPVVTEFVDLQCPFCAEFSKSAFNQVVADHVRPGEIRYELRVIAFLGDDSTEAAELAAAAALQNKLYEFTETFYLNQGEENTGYVTDDFLTDVAEQTPGLDAEQAMDDRDSPGAQALMEENEQAASDLGINSTPSFVLADGGEPTPLELNELTPDAFTEALAAAQGG